MKNKLKELAKTLFFKQVLNDFYRNSFLQKIETHEVQDKREDGFYCSYCSKMSEAPTSFLKKDVVIFPKKASGEIWIVNSHYDGCRGWD
jgi:hypothetical protein